MHDPAPDRGLTSGVLILFHGIRPKASIAQCCECSWNGEKRQQLKPMQAACSLSRETFSGRRRQPPDHMMSRTRARSRPALFQSQVQPGVGGAQFAQAHHHLDGIRQYHFELSNVTLNLLVGAFFLGYPRMNSFARQACVLQKSSSWLALDSELFPVSIGAGLRHGRRLRSRLRSGFWFHLPRQSRHVLRPARRSALFHRLLGLPHRRH